MAVRATEPVRRVLDALSAAGRKMREVPSGWEAQCPAHDDGNASLSVTVGQDGRALVRCHANCDFKQVVSSLGLEPRDLFMPKAGAIGPSRGGQLVELKPRPRPAPVTPSAPKVEKRDRGQVIAEYDYFDEAGRLVQQTRRYWNDATKKKSFGQRWPDPATPGGWVYSMKQADPSGEVRQVLFHLPQVLRAVAENKRVWVVEGEKDVLSLERLGLVATCNAMGAGKWKASHAESLIGASEVVIIADKDKAGREHAHAVAESLHGWVAHVRVVEVPADGCKDATDWIEKGALAPQLEQLAAAAPEWSPAPPQPAPAQARAEPEIELRDAPEEPEYLRDIPPPGEPPPSSSSGGGDGGQPPEEEPNLRSRSYLSLVRILSTPRLRRLVLKEDKIELNEMGEQLTIGRRPLMPVDISKIRASIEQHFLIGGGLKFSRDDVSEAVRQVAEDARYHPVQEYLRGLKWDGTKRLEKVADELLDITNPKPIVSTMLRKWFIGAVARAMRPGCKVKAMLILIGAQNAAKSTFFEVLASRDWFSDTAIDIHNKEAHVVLSSVWIQEWAELREMQGRTAEAVKNFISSPEGKFLPKYANIMVTKRRTSVIVGTTNETRFLDDATGNVRYWPVVVGREINLDGTRAQRDQLWAEARVAFDAGERWWLTGTEEHQLAELQKDHEQIDPWEDIVLDFAEKYIGHLTLEILMTEGLHLRSEQISGREAKRVQRILRQNGWDDSSRPREGKRRLRAWVRSEAQPRDLDPAAT